MSRTDNYAPKSGRQQAKKKAIIPVDGADCEKGGSHSIDVKVTTKNGIEDVPRRYCIKCDRYAADLDAELNGSPR